MNNSKKSETVTLFPEPKKIINALVFIAFILIACSVAVNAGVTYKLIANEEVARKIKQFFNLNAEFNLPTVFSFLLLNFTSLTLFMIYRARKASEEKWAYLWGILSLGFFFIGLDEIMMIHEKVAVVFSNLLNIESSTRYYLWVIPYSLPIIYIAYLYYPFLMNLSFRHRRNFIIAAGLYVGGGFFVEILGAWHQAYFGLGFIHSLIFTFEEGLEILGVIFFIKSLFIYWRSEIGNFQFSISLD